MTRRCLTCDQSKQAHELLKAGVELGCFEACICARYRAPFWWRRLQGRK